MRITSGMLINDYIRNLNKNYNEMGILQTQLSSGKSILKSSDNPSATRKAMEIRSSILRIKQYTGNVIDAKEWCAQTETALNEINSLIGRVYELTVEAANGSNGEGELNAIADEIEQLMEQLVVSANTSFGSKSIFGGMNTMSKPFEVRDIDGENVIFYNGHNLNELTLPENEEAFESLREQRVNYEIGFGTKMDISFNGIDILGAGPDNVYATLDRLVTALRAGDNEVISESVDIMRNKQNNIISLLGEIGGKTNRLDLFAKRLEGDDNNYTIMLEDTEGIDIERVLLEFRTKEMIYQAALTAGSRIIVPTLADFLR